MTVAALVLGVALAVACVLYVARPFLREPEPVSDRLDERDEHEQQRVAALEARDRALAALKELEFDHRTGTIADDDYRALVGPLRRQAAEALRAVDALSGLSASGPPGEPEPPSANGVTKGKARARR